MGTIEDDMISVYEARLMLRFRLGFGILLELVRIWVKSRVSFKFISQYAVVTHGLSLLLRW